MLIFVSSLVFGTVLNTNPQFMQAIGYLGLSNLPPVIVMGALALTAILCALAGLHVTVTGTLVLALGMSAHGAMSDMAGFILILFGWSVGTMLSLSSLALSATASTFGATIWTLIYGRNLWFAIGMGTMLTIILTVLDKARF